MMSEKLKIFMGAALALIMICVLILVILTDTSKMYKVINVTPAGKYLRTLIVEGGSTGPVAAMTTKGPVLGVALSGSDRSLVETEKATYQVSGLFVAGKGDELEVRTKANRSKMLCIHGTVRCFTLLE